MSYENLNGSLFCFVTLMIYRLTVMGWGTTVLGLALLLLLTGITERHFTPPLMAQPSSQEVKGQMLPIAAEAEIGSQLIQLEVAQTPRQQALGLMFRTSLAPNRGMLFPFDRPRVVGFWMKNCKISLDMIFLRNGIVQGIEAEVPPCLTDSCPSYGPNVPVDQVIELRGGRAQELGLQMGDRISVQPLSQ